MILTRHVVADGMILRRTRSVRLITDDFKSASTRFHKAARLVPF
jgi:hypothetical protein